MRIRLCGLVTIVLVLSSWSARANACTTVSTCVSIARKTPAQFSTTLAPLLAALPTDALLAGAAFSDPNPVLVGRVRAFAIQQAYDRKLSDAQVDAVYAKYTAGPDDLSELLRGPLTKSARGKKLLVAYMQSHDDARALRVAWALAADPAASSAELTRARELVWARYLRERKASTDEHDALLDFMANQPKDFAAPALALVTEAIAAKQPLLADDLDLMSRQPTRGMIDRLLSWSDTQPLAQMALLRAVYGSPDEALNALRGPKRAALEAVILRASASPDSVTRILALNALSRVYAAPLLPSDEARARFIALSADPDASVREAAYRPMGSWIDDRAIRAAVTSGARRWDRMAVTIVSHDPKDKLASWRRDSLLGLLETLPEKDWHDGNWQHELVFIGTQLERVSGHKAGFAAFGGELVGRCGNDSMMEQIAAADLQMLDPAAYATWQKTQPKALTPDEQAKSSRERATKLGAARDKLLASFRQ